MDMPRTVSSYWQYIDQDCPSMFDPRVTVSQHIHWATPGVRTTFRGVEPDNYNFGIFDVKPHDLIFMQHQCWYKVKQTHKGQKIRGWVSLYIAEEQLQSTLFNREILKLQPRAVWRYPKAQPIRQKRTQLDREHIYRPKSDSNFSTEERLWQMGYYENLQRKYFDGDENFIKIVGTPRGCVLTAPSQEDLEQEVEDF